MNSDTLILILKSKANWNPGPFIAAVLLTGIVCCSAALAQSENAAPAVVVNTAHGGFILGYDIDQSGTEGILAEALTLSDGKHDVALEVFDQTTGKILKILTQQKDTNNDFVALGIYNTGVALVEQEKSRGLFVDQRLYATLNPLSANKISGKWTPSLTKNQLILGIAPSQGTTNTAVLASQGFNSFVFSTNVAANTFGSNFNLPANSVFGFNDSPVLGYDSATNQAIVGGSGGGILENGQIAEVDLTAGTVTQFTGLGFGFINGIAVDSADGIACTTTEIDFSLEFYDLKTQTGFIVPIIGAVSQSQSGRAVAFDPIHKLFLIGQEFSSTGSGSSIQVYDTQGNFVKSINGLSLPASPAYMALNPAKRTGYVIVTPALTQLTQFTY